MQVIRKVDFNRARYIVGDVIGVERNNRVRVRWEAAKSRSALLPDSLIELDAEKLADLKERVNQRKAQERLKWIEDRPFVCTNVNPLARAMDEGHRCKALNLLSSQVKDGKCYYCGAPVVARCQRCEKPAVAESEYCEQCQNDLA